MCPNCKNSNSKVIKKGFFKRKRSRKVQRYFCLDCRRGFSDQTGRVNYRLKKFHLRNRIYREICSGVSQREMARKLRINRSTVANYLPILARLATPLNKKTVKNSRIATAVFDEMETFEHSKCKPVAIVVAVEDENRTILSLRAAQMPAKGKLAAISRNRYGPRKDYRPGAIRRTLLKLRKNPQLKILKSDLSPRYPKYVREVLPHVIHEPSKGREACVVGQGELKKGGNDPLFYLNHACAMVRDSIKRLTRKTWCTTKKVSRLQWILDIYMSFFNQRIKGVLNPVLGS